MRPILHSTVALLAANVASEIRGKSKQITLDDEAYFDETNSYKITPSVNLKGNRHERRKQIAARRKGLK